MGAQYLYLQKRVTMLRRWMLPTNFEPTGLYSQRVHQRTAAFRLLVHAEFENFVEDLVGEHARQRIQDWSTKKAPSLTIAALLAYDEAEGKPPTSLLSPPQKPSEQFDDRLKSALKRFQSNIRNNHGVREKNLLRMLMPIGIDAAKLDMDWLADLDSWAQERGTFAHRSSGKIGVTLDPAREYGRAKFLLIGFKQLDRAIRALP